MKTNTLDYLNQSLVEAIALAKSTGTNAVSFVKEQAPEIVQQLILREIIIEGMWTAAMLVISIACVIFLRRGLKMVTAKEYEYDSGFPEIPYLMGGIIGLIFSSVIFFKSLTTLLVVCITPKIWLLEYAAKLIK